jgi:hypothetical protein
MICKEYEIFIFFSLTYEIYEIQLYLDTFKNKHLKIRNGPSQFLSLPLLVIKKKREKNHDDILLFVFQCSKYGSNLLLDQMS